MAEQPLEEKIAKVCHEANRAYCETLGDSTQCQWERAPQWQRESAVNGVQFLIAAIIDGEKRSPGENHENWLEQKQAAGWKYGPVKDAAKKEHPCFLPYEQLPVEQRIKDYIFSAIVDAMFGAMLRETNSTKQKPDSTELLNALTELRNVVLAEMDGSNHSILPALTRANDLIEKANRSNPTLAEADREYYEAKGRRRENNMTVDVKKWEQLIQNSQELKQAGEELAAALMRYNAIAARIAVEAGADGAAEAAPQPREARG